MNASFAPRALLVDAVLLVIDGCAPSRRVATRARPRALRLEAAEIAPPRATACARGTLIVRGGNSAVADFCLDKTEVTARAYNECVSGEGCTRAKSDVLMDGYDARDAALQSTFCNAQKQANLDHPVNCVDLGQAIAYCRWRRARLPTEAEWEWAARGGDEARPYPWGDLAPGARLLNACGGECARELEQHRRPRAKMFDDDDAWPGTSPVASFPEGASRDGILDLAGNVAEWTAARETDANGVVRGGGWASGGAALVGSTARQELRAASRDAGVGFRCATDAPAGN